MDETQMDDLKQFIAAQVSQSEVRLGERIDEVETKLSEQIDEVLTEMREGFQGAGDAVVTIHDKDDEQDGRLEALESSVHDLQQAAA